MHCRMCFSPVSQAMSLLAPCWACGGRCSRKLAEMIVAQLTLTQHHNTKYRRSHRRNTIKRLHKMGIVLKNLTRCNWNLL